MNLIQIDISSSNYIFLEVGTRGHVYKYRYTIYINTYIYTYSYKYKYIYFLKCVISTYICLVFALKQINENKLQDQLLTHLYSLSLSISLFSFCDLFLLSLSSPIAQTREVRQMIFGF